MSNNFKKIGFWTPGYRDRVGGIQTFSTFFNEALASFVEVDSISMHDIDGNGCGNIPLRIRPLAFSLKALSRATLSKPDLIITAHLNFAPLCRIIRSVLGVPYWVIAHGVEAWKIDSPLRLEALKKADKILAVSQMTAERIVEAGYGAQDKITIFPNTADSDRFQIRPKSAFVLEKHALKADKKIILTVARLDKSEQYKGYDSVIEILNILKISNPNIHYLIVGDGDDRPRIESLIAQYNLQEYVTLTGKVSSTELPLYYNTSDLFVMPSTGEGFGIVFLEALFSGIPCIGGATDGARDALLNGELGYLVNPKDKNELSNTILKAVVSHSKPEELRKKALETYGFDVFKSRLGNLVRQ